VPVDPGYLLQARQMQALSFAVHIPLVCFGVALPVMVLFCEWRCALQGANAGDVADPRAGRPARREA
jgi:hypothetical protein